MGYISPASTITSSWHVCVIDLDNSALKYAVMMSSQILATYFKRGADRCDVWMWSGLDYQ